MDDHKKKKHSAKCNLCDFGPDLTDNVQVHKREYHNIKGISCSKCSQVCDSVEALKTHTKQMHTITQEPQRRKPYCRFWNYSSCTRGSSCEYLHEEAPYCPHGIECRRGRKCQLFHEEFASNQSFLGHPQRQPQWKTQHQGHRQAPQRHQ